jgi:hypothetical protein
VVAAQLPNHDDYETDERGTCEHDGHEETCSTYSPSHVYGTVLKYGQSPELITQLLSLFCTDWTSVSET